MHFWDLPTGNNAYCSVALTVATIDWHIFTVRTVVNAPVFVSTFDYWRLVACTMNAIKSDLSTAVAVVPLYISTRSVAHTKTSVTDMIFPPQKSQFIYDGKIVSECMYEPRNRRRKFYRATRMHRANYAVTRCLSVPVTCYLLTYHWSVHPSVCPFVFSSHLSKWLNIYSNFFHPTPRDIFTLHLTPF